MTESERLRQLEDKLCKAADQLRANSSLAASQYSIPVLGLIFLRYADVRFTQLEKGFAEKATGRREIGKADYQAQGVMYVPETARFSYLRGLSEGSDAVSVRAPGSRSAKPSRDFRADPTAVRVLLCGPVPSRHLQIGLHLGKAGSTWGLE